MKRSRILLNMAWGMGFLGSVVLCQEAAPTIEFPTDSFFEFEDEGAGEVEVRRTGDLSLPVSVDYRAESDLAEANVDFVPTSGTLDFAVNEDTATFEVAYIDDAIPEGSEPITLTLSRPTGGAILGTQSTARLFVQDNERRGTLIDRSFDGAIGIEDFVSDLALLPDGRVMASGVFGRPGSPITDRILLFDQEGRRDRDFDMENEVPNSGVFSIALQEDGKVVMGGTFTAIGPDDFGRIARVRDDGLIDPQFKSGAGVEGANAAVFDIVVQPDGKILIGGRFETYDGVSRPGLARLNPDGTLDSGFDVAIASRVTTFINHWVSQIRVQEDGKIIIVGQFTEVDGRGYRNVARLEKNGRVDLTFDVGGGVTGRAAFVDGVAIQEDGKVLIGGDFSAVNGNAISGIARLNADGSFDPSFDPGLGIVGINRIDDSDRPGLVSFIEVLEEGKILLAGDFETYDDFGRRGIARVLPDGTLDGSFGPYYGTTYRNGQGYEEYDFVTALAVQEDGKIITGAVFEGENNGRPARLSRLLSANVVSNTVEFDHPNQSVVENEGTIEVPVVRRGQSDSTFSVDYFVLGGTATQGEDYQLRGGRITFEPLETVKQIIIDVVDDSEHEENETIELGIRNASNDVGFGEPVSTRIEIVDPYRPGNLDFTFEPVLVPFTGNPLSLRPVTDIVIQPDRKILMSGYYLFVNTLSRAGLTRIHLDGRIDESFVPEVPEGEIIVEFVRMGLQPSGNVAGGLRQVVQLTPEGTLNPGFDASTTFTTALAADSEGNLIVSDNFPDASTAVELNEVVRLRPDGSVDSGFIPASLNDVVIAIAPLRDGKILIGGEFTQVNGASMNRIARLNANGSRDRSFDVGLGVEGVDSPLVIDLLEQPDGKVLLAGEFSLVDGQPRTNLARLNQDGSLDTSFDPGFGPDFWVESLALQVDQKILIGGGFSRYDGVERSGLARLNPDGSLDESFVTHLTFSEGRSVTAIAVQEDGQILIGGSFSHVNGYFRQGFARINGDEAARIIPPEPQDSPLPDGSIAILSPTLRVVPRGASGAFEFEFDTVVGATYAIQSSQSLSDWSTIASIEADAATESFRDPDGGRGTTFFRVLVPGP